MTPIADMVEQMLTDGVAGSAIVLAVRTVELATVTCDASRYVTGDGWSMKPSAVRMRRKRAKDSENTMLAEANDAAQQTVSLRHGMASHVTQRCDLSSIKEEGTSEKGSKKEKKKGELLVARARGTRITEDWQPDDERREFARSLGLDPTAVRDEFVDFWIAVPGSRGLKLDWQKTFKNRAREVAGRRGRVNGVHAPRPGSKDDTRERTVNALRSLDPFPYRDDAGRGESAGSQVSGLLPFAKPA